MPATIPCPEPPVLRRVLLGDLSPADLERLGEHLLHCEGCAATLNGLRADDPLLQTLRGGDTVPSPAPAVQALIDRLSQPQAAVAGRATLPTASALPPADPSAEELLSRWHALRQQGQEVSAEELCAGRPDLLGAVRGRLEALARMQDFLGTTATPARATPPPDAPPPTGSVELRPPQGPGELGRLGGYRVLKQLGRGGMGVVFLAEDLQLERLIALKVMRPDLAARPAARQRFLREARATAKLKDDHVVAIYQVGEDNGVPFLAMEYLDGESLEGWLQRGGLASPEQVLRVARDVTRGLAAAHAKGLVHRDIKPANLWLESRGQGSGVRGQGEEGWDTGSAARGLAGPEPDPSSPLTPARVKILDFGLARGGVEEVNLTESGTVLGTPAYMAPEQGRGEAADARSDLFSLGCVLYRLCTGQVPFEGRTVMAVLTALATHKPAHVRQRNPQIPGPLADLVMRLLAKRRENRPPSARAVLDELQAIESEWTRAPQTRAPGSAAAPKVQTAAGRGGARRWLLAGVALLVLAGAGALGVVVLRITGKDGKQTEVVVPEGSRVTVNAKGDVDVRLPGAEKKDAEAEKGTASPLDRLDPAAIPAAERFDWQPQELVAVLGEHRQRHWGPVLTVAISRDGKQVATGGEGGQIRFWDPATGRERRSFRVNSDLAIFDISPEGKLLATQLGTNVIRSYDLTDGEFVRDKAVLESEALNGTRTLKAAGKWVVAAPGDQVVVWDLAGGQARPRLKRIGIRGVKNYCPFDLTADGNTLAFASGEKTVTLIDLTGTELRERAVVPQPAPVDNLALSPNGKRLAVGFQDGKVALWDLAGNTPVARGVMDIGYHTVLRFSPDGKRLAIAYTSIRLWNVEGPEPSAGEPFADSLGEGAYHDLAFAPDGRTLVTAHNDGTVRFWDIAGNPLERNPMERASYLVSNFAGFFESPCVFTLDGKHVVTAHNGGFTRLWDLGQAAPAGRARVELRWPAGLSPDGKSLLLSWGGTWSSYDCTGGTPREGERYSFGEDAVLAHPLPDRTDWVVGTNKGAIRLVERRAGESLVERGSVQAGYGRVRCLEVSPDGRLLATSSGVGVKLWDLTGPRPVLRDTLHKDQPVLCVGFAPDNRMLAVAAGWATTTVWDLQERPPRQWTKWQRDAEARTLSLSFSPDSRTLAAATERGKLVLHDPRTGTIRTEWQLPGAIYWVGYAPDGRHLLTVNGNGTGYILRLAPPPASEDSPR